MSSIFISHSHKDKGIVRKLAHDLKSHGVRVWVDEAELNVGDSLIQKISEGIEGAQYLGAVLTNNSIHSVWVQRELEIAINMEISGDQVVVLPLLFDDCSMPLFLSGKLYADFRDSVKYDDALLLLLKRLGYQQVDEVQNKQRLNKKPTDSGMDRNLNIYVHGALYDEEPTPCYKQIGHLSLSRKHSLKWVTKGYYINKHFCVDLIIPIKLVSLYDSNVFSNYKVEKNDDDDSWDLVNGHGWIEVYFKPENNKKWLIEEIEKIIEIHNKEIARNSILLEL